jgi:hypothetical protein
MALSDILGDKVAEGIVITPDEESSYGSMKI